MFVHHSVWCQKHVFTLLLLVLIALGGCQTGDLFQTRADLERERLDAESERRRAENQRVEYAIDSAIRNFHQNSSSIQLGQPKSQVLSVLPSQQSLGEYGRPPNAFMNGGKKVEIHYFRSSRIPDGKTTDDELTPYTFVDDKLVAIGWQAIGGPKSFGNPNAAQANNAARAALIMGLLGQQQQQRQFQQQQNMQRINQQRQQQERVRQLLNRNKRTVNCGTVYGGGVASTTCR